MHVKQLVVRALFGAFHSFFLAFFWGRPMRRVRLVLAGGVVFACTVRHVDEVQVRAVTAQQMACDPQLVQLESEDSPGEGVARYTVRGCDEQRMFDCTQHGKTVQCESTDLHREVASNGAHASYDDTPTTNDNSGCDCGNLFASHSSSPAASPANNSVMPSTQRINNNGR
jgi:hypothetical protein